MKERWHYVLIPIFWVLTIALSPIWVFVAWVRYQAMKERAMKMFELLDPHTI
jgi:hypothetical protein